MGGRGNILVGHHDEVALCGVLVRLELVVRAMDSCAACKKEKEFRGAVGIVGGFADVDFDVVEFGHVLVIVLV